MLFHKKPKIAKLGRATKIDQYYAIVSQLNAQLTITYEKKQRQALFWKSEFFSEVVEHENHCVDDVSSQMYVRVLLFFCLLTT
jgi:hypothetical protein